MATRTCSTSPMPYSRKYVPSVMSRTRRPSAGSIGTHYGTSGGSTSLASDRYAGTGTNRGTSTIGTAATSRYQSPNRGSSYEPTRYTSTTTTTRLGGGSGSLLPSSTLTSNTTGHRPLPAGGPGPLDERGRKIDIQDALSRSRFGRSESVGGTRPLRATHLTTVTTTDVSPRRDSPANDHFTSGSGSKITTGGGTLPRRTNSISNLASDLDNLHVTSPSIHATPTSTLGRRGRTGSHNDLRGASTVTTPDREPLLYDGAGTSSTTAGGGAGRVTLSKNYYNTGAHSYDYRETEASDLPATATGSSSSSSTPSVLPNIKKTGGLAGRSPSLDRLRADDDTRSPTGSNGTTTGTRRTLITNGSTRTGTLERRNSRGSPEATGANGLTGLKNLGNTCFMNSIVQCLSHTRLLREHCLSDDYKEATNRTSSSVKGALINAYAKLIKSLWKVGSDSYVSPTEFKSQIAKFAPRFVGYNQQDAQEFLIYLLEGLHEEVNRVATRKKPVITEEEGEEKISASEKATQMWKRYLDRDNSKIVDLFVGQLKSALKCTTCGYTSNTFDPYWDLSLPIKKRGGSEVSLLDCFELFTQEEVLDGDEKPTCARCKTRRKCTKSLSIQRFPKILIIHLKRFNPESFIRAKLSTLVDFPLKDLDLSKFAAEKSQAPVLYNLYAVSNHSGTTFSGHYTAYCKSSKTNDWHHFNDTRVSTISSNHLRSSEAYVLFYELSGSSHPSRL